jgi:hypothetical protein
MPSAAQIWNRTFGRQFICPAGKTIIQFQQQQTKTRFRSATRL